MDDSDSDCFQTDSDNSSQRSFDARSDGESSITSTDQDSTFSDAPGNSGAAVRGKRQSKKEKTAATQGGASETEPRKKRSSIRRRVAKSVRRATKRISGRINRIGHRALPSELTLKAASKTKMEKDPACKLLHMVTLMKLVLTPRHAKDPIEKVRSSLILAWNVALETIEQQIVAEALHLAAPLSQSQYQLRYLSIYYDTVISVMVREEVNLLAAPSEGAGAVWIQEVMNLHLRTHTLVKSTLGSYSDDHFGTDSEEHQSLILFCAKSLAINYFVVPKLAQVIVAGVSRGTSIKSRRSRNIGGYISHEAVNEQLVLYTYLPVAQKIPFTYYHQVCSVNVTGESDQHPATRWNAPPFLRPPGTILETPPATLALFEDMAQNVDPKCAPLNILDRWPTQVTAELLGGHWTDSFAKDAGKAFVLFSTFMDFLLRRSKTLFTFRYYKNKSDSRLGINERTVLGIVFMPGFCELSTCFLRHALLSEHALKQKYRIGAGPPSIVCNWTERTAACILALSLNATIFSCLIKDLMEQTSITHVADVMALLHSLKTLIESFSSMHNVLLPENINIDLILRFISQLLRCPHYIVIMFTLRWLYDCLDYFCEDHRVEIIDCILREDIFIASFCHWEPAVRDLLHMLILFRLYRPSFTWQQEMLVQTIVHQMEQRPFDASLLEQARPTDVSDGILQRHRNQLAVLSSFIGKVMQHFAKGPAVSVEGKDPVLSSNFSQDALDMIQKLLSSRYTKASTNQLLNTAMVTITWLNDHRQPIFTSIDNDGSVPLSRSYIQYALLVADLQNRSDSNTLSQPARHKVVGFDNVVKRFQGKVITDVRVPLMVTAVSLSMLSKCLLMSPVASGALMILGQRDWGGLRKYAIAYVNLLAQFRQVVLAMPTGRQTFEDAQKQTDPTLAWPIAQDILAVSDDDLRRMCAGIVERYCQAAQNGTLLVVGNDAVLGLLLTPLENNITLTAVKKMLFTLASMNAEGVAAHVSYKGGDKFSVQPPPGGPREYQYNVSLTLAQLFLRKGTQTITTVLSNLAISSMWLPPHINYPCVHGLPVNVTGLAKRYDWLSDVPCEYAAVLRAHASSCDSTEQYPNVNIPVPPLQHMTSAYIKGRMRKKQENSA